MKTKKNRSKQERIGNVKIKDDFYSYVNKKWINDTKIPLDEPLINNFTILKSTVDNQLKDIIKKSLKLNSNLSVIYENSLKWNDNEVKKSLCSFLNEMKYLLNCDIYKFLAFLIINGFGNIITLDVQQCIYNPKKRMISLDAGFQPFPPNYYREKKYERHLKFYEYFLKKYFEVFGRTDISNIVEIEAYLTSIVKTKTFLRETENSYFLMTNDECIKKCGFDWAKLLTYLGVELPKKIIIRQPDYLKQMMIYFENWNSDFFAPFWTYKILMTGIKFHSQLYKLGGMFQKFIHNIQKVSSSSDRMLGNVKFFMNFYLNELYNKHYSNNVLFCKKLVQKAILVLVKRLKNNKWLSKETMKRAIEKIEHIQIFIGNKPKMDKSFDIVFTDNMFDNYVKLNRAILKDNVKKMKNHIFPDTFYLGDMSSYEINANYSPTTNSIFISNSILQPPFITKNYIHTLAFLGIIICHELIHALDDEGCKYDKDGVFNNWWNSRDKKKYEIIKKKVLKLFQRYSKNTDVTEKLKMGENIADLSSMKIAEDMLDNYLDENNITDKEKYFEQFYEYYAEFYRTQNYKTYYDLVKDDYHSYGKFRINCVLANSGKFREYYEIENDNNMYSEVIDIW
jgi:putative endopeptidase